MQLHDDERGPVATLFLLGGFVLLLHAAYSAAVVLDPGRRSVLFATGSVAFLLLVLAFAATGLTRRTWSAGRRAASVLADELAWIFPVVMIASADYFTFSNAISMPSAMLFVVASLVLRRVAGANAVIVFSSVVVAVLLAGKYVITPLDPNPADMLPVIIAEARYFLSGVSPYGQDYSAVTDGPVYYLPLQWLFYMPLVALRLDPRLLNILCLAGTVALFLVALRHSPRPTLCAGLMVGMLASRPVVEMLVQGHHWPMWLLCAAYATAITRDRPVVASLLLGALLAASQTMLLLLALAAAHQANALGLRRAVLLSGLSVLVFLTIVLPITGFSMRFFIDHYILLPEAAGVYSDRVTNNPTSQVSLTNLLVSLGLGKARPLVQVTVGLAGMLAVSLRGRNQPAYFLSVAGICYIAAISLNMQVWKYYYMPGLLWLLWAAMQRQPAFDQLPFETRVHAGISPRSATGTST